MRNALLKSFRSTCGRQYDVIVKKGSFLHKTIKFVLSQKPISWLVSLIVGRSHTRIEIDITYACNLKCLNCNRSCTQAPANEYMQVEQIKKFIAETVENSIIWQSIRILGGEPTLHPDIQEIIQLLLKYKKDYAPKCEITLCTNGFGASTNKILLTLPKEILIENTMKDDIHQDYFCAFNIAPSDLKRFRFADFSIGCRWMYICGIGLTPFGYYPCAVAGGIDRVLGFDIGRKKIPSKKDSLKDQLSIFCRYCGDFHYKRNKKEIMTPAWISAYKKYNIKKPKLSRY